MAYLRFNDNDNVVLGPFRVKDGRVLRRPFLSFQPSFPKMMDMAASNNAASSGTRTIIIVSPTCPYMR